MSFGLALHFETNGSDGPRLIRTEFRISTNGKEERRTAVEAHQQTPAGVVRHEFHWNPKTTAVRGFALLCLRHILALRERRTGFVLDKAASRFAGSLAEAARRTETGKNDWLRAIVGVGEFNDADGPRRLFGFPTNCSWVRFEADKWHDAAFHFFIDGQDVSDDWLRLRVLADAIEHGRALPAPPAPIVEPPLSIRLYSRADLNAAPFLCVVCDAARLRERGLLPLPAEIEAQIQVALPEPRHFILFAFGPKLAPLPCYPLSALADGEPRARLDLPRDLDPRAESIPLAGEPGAECLLMLLRPHAAAQAGPADVRSIQSRLARLLADTGAFALPHLDEPFRAAGALDSPQTREFNLRRAGPATDPLRRFLGEIQSRFAGEFAAHHFLGVARAEAPTTER